MTFLLCESGTMDFRRQEEQRRASEHLVCDQGKALGERPGGRKEMRGRADLVSFLLCAQKPRLFALTRNKILGCTVAFLPMIG